MGKREPLEIEIKKINQFGQLPTKGTDDAAGWDLYLPKDVTINSHSSKKIPLGIAMAIPNGYFGKIEDRSGAALRINFTTKAGVIDSDYRDEIGVVIANLSDSPVEFLKEDRLCQMVLHENIPAKMVEVKELGKTERKGGFGSTGK